MAALTALWRTRKPHNFNWTNDTLKKRFFGGKIQESNGSKKEKKTLPSSTKPWFSANTTIESSNCTTTRAKLFTPSTRFKRNSFITFKSYLCILETTKELPLSK